MKKPKIEFDFIEILIEIVTNFIEVIIETFCDD